MQITPHFIIIMILSIVGLYTTIVYFLTIMSPNKKVYKKDKKFQPKVSIIIPVWNEGSKNGERLRKTVESLLKSTYPQEKIEIIIVNDGSTDNSLQIAREYEKFGAKVFSHPKSKGKTNAINTGLKHATGELVAGFDADSYMDSDVLEKLVPCFKDKKVMGAIPSVKIEKPKTFLQMVQAQEFLSAVFIRHVQSELGAIPLAPGAFTLVRKEFIKQYGFLNPHTMVEDLELSLRIQSKKYLIEHIVDANVYTTGVKTMKAFTSQRIRWFYGFMIQIKKYKHLFSKKYGNLGLFILPTSVVFILFTVLMFFYTLIKMLINMINWFKELVLVGFDFKHLFEINFDPFFLTFDNTTILPIILLLIILGFMFYTKRITNQKEGIIIPFVAFTLSYWILGSFCWVLAIYYYIRKKPVKWGPNYFNS